ncbi:peptidase M16 [Cytophagales bacterium WSM2-2]|nr:peptidase M16 [Cytophagales bacterium WSM2-2]
MLNRSVAPAFNKDFSFELPKYEVIPLNDSTNLIFLSGLQQEVFKLEFIFRAGKWYEPKSGCSHFTAIMLEKGTESKSSRELAQVFDYYGAQVEISPGYDYTSVSLYGLKKSFREIFAVFQEIVTTPVFPEEELELQKKIFLQNLKVNNEKNSFVASKLIRKNVFGPAHPYGSSVEEEDLNSINSSELRGYFASQFSPLEVYLIGNFSSSEISWITSHVEIINKPVMTGSFLTVSGLNDEKITKEDSIQSSIRLGKRTINRNHPDYFCLLLLNHILGGYFGSRLMKNIREEKGLTYGIYSSINPFRNDCLFSIGADVGKDKLELAISEIKKELRTLSEASISDEELTTARNHLLGSLQLEVANPFSSFDKIKNLRLNNLEKDYYASLFSVIQSLTSEDLQSMAKKYFASNDFHEVAVG